MVGTRTMTKFEIFLKLSTIVIIRRANMLKIILSQKTSNSLCRFYISDY